MPTTNEKQLTAVMMLREKIQAKISECGETPKTQYALGFKEALEMIESDWIPNQALATERQQLIDFYNAGAVDSMAEAKHYNSAEQHFKNTFKPQ